LIELLVVLLIIGILLAIAIPTFLSSSKNASDTAAQANLATALTSAKAYYTQPSAGQSFSGILEADANMSSISQITDALTFYSGSNSTGINSLSLSTAGNGAADALELTAWAPATRNCWIVVDLSAPQAAPGVLGETQVGEYYAVDANTPAASCTAGSSTAFTSWPASVVAQSGSFPTG
jgi:type IV pilus assembly protein PilA